MSTGTFLGAPWAVDPNMIKPNARAKMTFIPKTTLVCATVVAS
jgi:hypothetical protein